MIQPIDPSDRGDGRRPDGRWAKGKKGGPGSYLGQRIFKYRKAVFDAVSPEEVVEVMQAMVKNAKGGDVAAAKVVFERLLGAAEALDVAARLEVLEQSIRDFMATDVLGHVPEQDDSERWN